MNIDGIVYIVLLLYGAIWVLATMFMVLQVGTTPGNLEKPFTPWQTFFGPVVWPLYLAKAVIWWFKTSWSLLCCLYRCLRTNEWQ